MARLLEPTVEMPNTAGTDLKTTTNITNQATLEPNIMQPTSQKNSPIRKPNEQVTTQTTQVPQNQAQQNQTQQNQVQQNQLVQQPNPTISVQRPSDFYDNTVQSYLNDYESGVARNNFQAQINALTSLDKYRVDNGYKPLYTDNIYELMNQRTEKIKNQIKDYENQMAYANSTGDYDSVQAIGQELENYKKMVNYQDTPNNSANYLANQEEYRSAYDETIDSIVSELLTMRFTYNPNEDEAFLKAQQYATNKAFESMNAKGTLYSSMTAQIVSATIANLQTEYMKMAKEDFYENVDRLKSMANFIIDLDDRAYKRWQNETARNLEYYSALRDEMDFQNKRVEQLGYVDNTASIILGIPVGTLSASARKAISEAQAESQNQYNKLMSDIALAEAKAEINARYSQATDYVKTQNSINEYLAKKTIDSQFGTNSSNNTIKNEAGVYKPVDENSKFTGQLKAETLINAISSMDLEKAIAYARENANSRDTWIQALNALDVSEEEANKALTSNTVDQSMNYVDSLLSSGKLSVDDWKGWYTGNGLDWVERSNIYKTISEQIGNQYSAEQEAYILKQYMNQGLDDEIGNRLYEEIKDAYGLTDEEMLDLLS